LHYITIIRFLDQLTHHRLLTEKSAPRIIFVFFSGFYFLKRHEEIKRVTLQMLRIHVLRHVEEPAPLKAVSE